MIIGITNNQFTIAGTQVNFPLPADELRKILGEARITKSQYNDVYTWDELGICGYSNNGKEVQSLCLVIKKEEFDFSPNNVFTSDFFIDECSYADYYQQHFAGIKKISKLVEGGTFIVGDFSIYYDIDENEIITISLEKYIEPAAKVYSDKYAYKKIEGEKIEFADFNFKLAVIQELMYNKKLIKPEFELYDFVDNFKEREIDVEEEGYAFIPEVIDYFKNLEIDKKFADEIEQIIQDGGDDIYGNVLRFWDGEDDTFSIRNFEDVKHFKNLRKMRLFYSDHLNDEIRSYLKQYNIEVK
jgi:hypothetical protein